TRAAPSTLSSRNRAVTGARRSWLKGSAARGSLAGNCIARARTSSVTSSTGPSALIHSTCTSPSRLTLWSIPRSARRRVSRRRSRARWNCATGTQSACPHSVISPPPLSPSTLDVFAGIQAATPAQLGATDAVEIVVHRVNEAQGFVLLADANTVPRLDQDVPLAIAGHQGVKLVALADANLHRAAARHGDGPTGEGVGIHGHQHQGIEARMHDGATGGQGVGGGAGGGRD